MNVVDRIAALRKQISQYDYEYHVLDAPTVSDAVWDGLFAELKKLEAQNPELITTDSPTQRLRGDILKGFKKVTHKSRMVSLNDVFSAKEVQAWLDRISKLDDQVKTADFWAEIKMDGLACSIIYEDGMLARAVTRGDGFVGEDVTSNVKTIRSVPLKLRGDGIFNFGRTEVRGEIVMYKSDFEKLNADLEKRQEKTYANPRNLAAGTIRQLDPAIAASRKLYFRAYDLIRDQASEIPTQVFAVKTLKQLGFLVSEPAKLLKNIDEIFEFSTVWRDKRHTLAFNTDGLVIKINDRNLAERLGIVGKHPRGAIAFKYPAEQATTILKDIFISIGRTGAATPVAMLDPVVVAGSTVQMATLHNDDEITRKGLLIGDTVIIQKAGDIIPEVMSPIVTLRNGTEQKFVMPTHCPDCNTKLIKPDGEVVWRCPNTNCSARTWRHIQHFASKAALDIDGLGEKNVIALLDSGLINDAADLYALQKDQLLALDRFAELSAQNLIDAIKAKNNPPLAKFVFALGIRHVGAQTAIDLANTFRNLNALAEADIDALNKIDGVGEVVAESIVAWFADSENQQLLLKFYSNGVIPQVLKAIHNGPLTGKSFAITGSLSTMSREAAADKIRGLGGTFQSSVGKGTTYLVTGANTGNSKIEKANKLNVTVLSEEELNDLLLS